MADNPSFARSTFLSGLLYVVQSMRGIFFFLVARLLGEVSLGMLSVGWSWADLLSKFGTWGLDRSTTIHTAAYLAQGRTAHARHHWWRSLRKGVLLSLIVAAGVWGTLFLFGMQLSGDARVVESLIILIWVLPFVAAYRISNAASWGMKEFGHNIVSRGFVEPAVTTASFLAGYLLGIGLTTPLYALICGYAACSAVSVILSRRGFSRRARAGAKKKERLRSKKPGSPVTTSAGLLGWVDLLYLVHMRLDVIMLSLFASASWWPGANDGDPLVDIAMIGAYGISTEIAWGVRKIRNVFDPVYTPLLSGTAALGTFEKDYGLYVKTCRWVLALQLGLLGTLAIGAPFVMYIFGAYFVIALPWFILLLFANLMNGFLLTGAILDILRPRLNIWSGVVALLCNAALTLLLIPLLGPLGAAIATLTANTLQSVLRIWQVKRYCGISVPWPDLRPSVTAFIFLLTLFGAMSRFLGQEPAPALFCAILFAISYIIWLSRAGFDKEFRLLLAKAGSRMPWNAGVGKARKER